MLLRQSLLARAPSAHLSRPLQHHRSQQQHLHNHLQMSQQLQPQLLRPLLQKLNSLLMDRTPKSSLLHRSRHHQTLISLSCLDLRKKLHKLVAVNHHKLMANL